MTLSHHFTSSFVPSHPPLHPSTPTHQPTHSPTHPLIHPPTPQHCTIPTWIVDTINTRNTVTLSPHARLTATSPPFQRRLKQYKNNGALFLQALVETIEADVRSKFQTKRRQEDCKKGVAVEVPFDNAMVHFLWRDDRVLEVVEVEIVSGGGGGVDGIGGIGMGVVEGGLKNDGGEGEGEIEVEGEELEATEGEAEGGAGVDVI